MSRRDSNRPRCLTCGKAIPKRFESYSVSPATANRRANGERNGRTLYFDSDSPLAPRTLADCQRFTNSTVRRIDSYFSGMVSSFSAWDGESYISPHFCKNGCAETFGRRAAARGVRL